MAEEVLRLRTTIIPDNAGARQIQANLQAIGRQGERTTQQLATGMTGFSRTVQNAARDIGLMRSTLAGLGVSRIVQGIGTITDNILALNRASKALGMSERDLRAWTLAGARVGISQQQVVAGLQGVDKKLFEIRHNIGDTTARLVGMGAGPVVSGLMRARNTAEGLAEVLRFKNTLLSLGKRQEAIAWLAEYDLGLEFLEQSADDVADALAKIKAPSAAETERMKAFGVAIADITTELKQMGEAFVISQAEGFKNDLNAITQDFKNLAVVTGAVKDFFVWWNSTAGEKKAAPKPEDLLGIPGMIGLDPQGRAAKTYNLGKGLPGESAVDEILKKGGIPGFQTGGITKSGGLSLLHPNEAVIPLGNQDVLKGSEQTLARADEEGTFRALIRYASYTQMGGLGGLPGLGAGGGPGVGGAGGTGGLGGQGGGGGGGDDPAGQQNTTAQQPSDPMAKGQFPMGMQPLYRGAGGGLSVKPSEAPVAGGGGGGLSKDAYDKMFAGTPLAGKYDQVVAAANANGVPPATMAAIMAHETGKGTSPMLKNKNNPAGLMEKGGASSVGQSFATLDEGIAKAGQSIGRNYQRGGGTIAGMQQSYAPTVNATNDPKGLNKSWTGGVSKYEQQLRAPSSTSVTPNPPGADGKSQSAAQTGELGPQATLAWARQNLGLDESRDAAKLKLAMDKAGVKSSPASVAWCAQFVNAGLAASGIKGTGSPAAGSFTKFGTAVEPGKVQAGDIGVVRGRSPRTGIEGSHVGFLTGESRMRNGRLEYKMLSGNENVEGSRGKVAEVWRSASSLHLRRPPAPTGTSQTAASEQRWQSKPQIGSPEKDLDRYNGASGQLPQSTVNLEVKHDGTRAAARVASSKGPAFAESKIKNQTQMQPTDEFGATGTP